MIPPFHIEAEWGPRKESPAELAARLARLLEGLAALHPAFARWNEMGDTREEADEPFCSMPPRLEELATICAAAQEQDESVGAWNGIEGPLGANFRFDAGFGHPYLPYRPFQNHAVIRLDRPSSENADLLNFPVMMSSLRAVVAALAPDFAAIEPFDYHDELPSDWPGTPAGWLPIYGAWLTYLCPSFAQKISPPAGIEIERTADGGLFMIAVPDLFDPEAPAHSAAVRTVHAALGPLLDRIRTEFSPPLPHG